MRLKCQKKIIKKGKYYCRYLLANGGCTKRDEIMCVEFADEELRVMKCVECGSGNIRWNGQSVVCLDCETDSAGWRIIPPQPYEVAP